MTKKARELSQIFGYEVFTAMYDKKRNKLFLHSTNSKFCHKDVAELLAESIQNANTKPCVSVYDEDHVREQGLPQYLLPEEPQVVKSDSRKMN
jgi:hypothetical protein